MAKCKYPGKCPMKDQPYETWGTIPAGCFWNCGARPDPEKTPFVRRAIDTSEIINEYNPFEKERR